MNLFGVVFCDNVDDNLNTLNLQMAKQYMKPFNENFARNLNHNWFVRPTRPLVKYWEWGFHFVSIGNTTPNENLEMSGSTAYKFNREQAYMLLSDVADPVLKHNLSNKLIEGSYNVNYNGPTFMGSANKKIVLSIPQIYIRDNDVIVHAITAQDLEINTTGVWKNYELYGTVVPQLDLGTLMGTNLSLRWMPKFALADDAVDYSVFGLCLTHNPEVWLKLASDRVLPFEITGQAYFQKSEFGDYAEITNKGYSAFISRTFHERELNWMPYLGLNLGTISSEYDYTVTIHNKDEEFGDKNAYQNYSFEYDDIQYLDMTIGNTVRFWYFDFTLDYTISEESYFSSKIGFSKIW